MLRPAGAMAIVGLTPKGHRSDWYIYKYFPGTYAADVRRFPAWGRLVDELIGLGADRLAFQWVERIEHVFTSREVLNDPFGQPHATSQLTLLTAEAYAAGRQRLEAAVEAAERTDRIISFASHLNLGMLVACRPVAYH